ncbi:MAG: hypothetical protein JWQ35_1104 [Bacteriovoracaceae bacterium]|nr:hypothetical protein [Bacteriovoracaceae bacterium]
MILSSLLLSFLIGANVQVEIELNNTPVAKQKVELFGFREGDQLLNKEQNTDSAGHTQFAIDTKSDMNMVIRSIYEGVQYFSQPFSAAYPPTKPIEIKVYKTVKSDEHIGIKDLRLFLSTDKEDLKIDEEILVENRSQFTVKGVETEQGGNIGSEVLRIGLPSGTHDLKFGQGFEEKETRFDGNDIVTSHPLIPGFTRFSIQYSVERSAMSAELSRKFSLPIKQLSLATDSHEMKLSGLPFIRGADKFFAGKMDPTYTVDLHGEREFKLSIHGLPLKIRSSQILPFILFFILLLLMLPLLKKASPELSEENKKALLKKIVLIKRMREKSLIDESEFQARRLKILERLIPFYET